MTRRRQPRNPDLGTRHGSELYVKNRKATSKHAGSKRPTNVKRKKK